MKKRLLLIFFIPFLLSCVTDEKLTESDNGGDDNGEDPEPVELIFNEPLMLFNDTYENVKAQEDRTLFSELEGYRLTYEETTKGNVVYQIVYHFENNLMTNTSVQFDFNQEVLSTIVKGLTYKYKMISEYPLIFLHTDTSRKIAVEYSSVSGDHISIDYY